MMNKNVTDLEFALLNWMANHEMNAVNGFAKGIDECSDADTFLWIDDIAASLGISVNAAKGVVGSATKKKLVWVFTESDPSESSIGFTDGGFRAWRNNV